MERAVAFMDFQIHGISIYSFQNWNETIWKPLFKKPFSDVKIMANLTNPKILIFC